MRERLYQLLAGLVIVLFVTGCSSDGDNQAWEEHQQTNTIEAYEKYIADFPEGKHVADAHGNIQDIIFTEVENEPSGLLEIFDNYDQKYPDGKYQSDFEELIYKEASSQNSVQAFEDYLQRFPDGKHTGEFETVLYNSIITDDSSTFTFGDYIQRYPEGKHLNEIEQFLLDSVRINNDLKSVERYKSFFPEGNFTDSVNSLSEKLYYDNAIKFGSVYEYNRFKNNYPKSEFIKTVNFISTPAGADLQITDVRGRGINNFTTPGNIQTLEGATLILKYKKNGYKNDSISFTVGSDTIQEYRHSLRMDATFITNETFDRPSRWEVTGSNFRFIINEEEMLLCETNKSQHQHIRNFNIDFSKDYTLEMSFRFIGTPNSNKSYIGFLWGSPQGLNYFLCTQDGKYNFGQQADRYRSGENENGYDKWNAFSGNQDTWPSTSSYRTGGFIKMVVEKKGNVLKYQLNGLNLQQENVFRTPNGKAVGIGFGNAEVVIDYLRI
ncbi:MAG: hypothetical protein K8R53_06900, partial [Bacteroidales bacterium]|nr:hypothetical protein [Bacteroidales bacterium]